MHARFLNRLAAAFGLVVMAGVIFVGTASAQSTGYFNEQAVVLNMSEYTEVQQTLQQEAQSNQASLQQQAQSLQQQMQQYRQQQGTLSQQARQTREQELMQAQQELQQQQSQLQQQLLQREQELLEPLFVKIQNALEEVSQEENLDVIFRISALSHVNEDEVVNVTPLVAEKLGLDISGETTGPELGGNGAPIGGPGN